jgi:hypothetical protein
MKNFLVLALAACLLTACAEKWQKPGSTEMDFEAIRSICTTRSNMRFPPLLHQVWVDMGYRSPIVTRCDKRRHSFTCSTYGGYYEPPRLVTIDSNTDPRHEDVRACLFENGWQPVS